MPAHPNQIAGGRIGAHRSWANTVDRTARTQRTRDASPGGIDYWLKRLDADRFAEATDEQRLAAAQSLKSAHYSEMALKSARSRKRSAKPATKAQK